MQPIIEPENNTSTSEGSTGSGTSASGEEGGTGEAGGSASEAGAGSGGAAGENVEPVQIVAPPAIQLVELKTGDTIDLKEGLIDQDELDSFTTFRSTQFFVNEFERSDQKFTNEADKEVEEEDEFPIWIIIVVVCIVIVFSIVIIFICIMMRKNRETERLTESAIARELALAK